MEFKRILAQQNQEQKYNDRLRRIWDFYEGHQINFTPSFANETEKHRALRPKFAPNLLRRATTDLSYLYANDPIRSSQSAERWKELFWARNEGFNALMLEADAMVRLTGTALAIFRPEDDGLDLWILPKFKFTAIADENNIRKLQAVLFEWNGEQLYMDSEVYYNPKTRIATPHNLGTIPACLLKNSISSNSVYGLELGGKDLLQNLATINQQFEQLTWTSELQRGQPVIVGKNATNLVLAPDAAIKVDEANGFYFANNAADITKMMNGLQMNLDSLAIALGISKRSFNVRSANDSLSAEVLYAAQLELSQDRQLRERVASIWERNIHTVANKIIAEVWGEALEIPMVKFVEFQKPISPSEILAKATFEKDAEIADSAKILQDLNPQVPSEQLAQTIANAQNENAEKRRQNAIVAGHNSDSESI